MLDPEDLPFDGVQLGGDGAQLAWRGQCGERSPQGQQARPGGLQMVGRLRVLGAAGGLPVEHGVPGGQALEPVEVEFARRPDRAAAATLALLVRAGTHPQDDEGDADDEQDQDDPLPGGAAA